MRGLTLLSLFALTSLSASVAQEKPSWMATPGYVFQQNKTYPSTIELRLFLNNCYNAKGDVIAPLKQEDKYTVVVTGTGVTASAPTVAACALTTTLTISAATQPG